MDEKEELEQLYQLYLVNRCSAEELNRFFMLINNSKDDRNILELMSASWDDIEAIPETGLLPNFLPKENIQIELPRTKKTRYNFRWVTTAAAVLLLMTGLFFFRSIRQNALDPVHQLASITLDSERKQLVLPDGTKVWLNPNSKLKYPEQFTGETRLLSLDGEAFFEVAHDAAHPFIVQSGKVSTKVLGTSFNISAYPQDAEINVTLVTGKVTVALKQEQNIASDTITANQQININKVESKITKRNLPDAADYLKRRLGIFEFKGATLPEVVRDLERQYQTRIQLSEELDKSMFYGNLDMTKPLTQTLDKFCTVMEVTWKKDGGQYVINR